MGWISWKTVKGYGQSRTETDRLHDLLALGVDFMGIGLESPNELVYV
jgi:hypothetical protein